MTGTAQPRLTGTAYGRLDTVVLVLPGGVASGRGAYRIWQPAGLRMAPFARSLRRTLANPSLGVWLLHYRVRGWNEPYLDPVRDAEWALGYARYHHPGTPVVLVGHSMGARVALRVAADAAVVGVCALAPWVESGEPVAHLAGRSVLVAHGERDHITDPRESVRFVNRARAAGVDVVWEPVPRDGHAMLLRPSRWTALTRDFILRSARPCQPQPG